MRTQREDKKKVSFIHVSLFKNYSVKYENSVKDIKTNFNKL